MSLQPVQARTQRRADVRQLSDEPRQSQSPWLLTSEAAEYLRYRGRHKLRSLYRFLAKHGVKTSRRNRTILIARRDLDAAIGATGRR